MTVKMQRLIIFMVFVGLCNGVSKASECVSQGRYPNDDVENCRGFTMCLIGGVNNFTQYKLICPVGFVYSHLEQQCTNITRYKCLESYNCTKMGSFVNSDSKNCTSYVACVEGINSLVSARLVECPEHKLFNPNKQMCENDTEFNCNRKSYDVLELASLDNNLYVFTSNVSLNNQVRLCDSCFNICLLLFLNYIIL